MTLVIIGGMHRSGTSLVCRLLNKCGMALGDSADLLPSAPDNPDGFWENRRFMEFNDELLRDRGESWDWPKPTSFDGADLSRHRIPAEALVRDFANGPFRGWKDPRNSLSLPFWLSVVPHARTVMVVRHPLEVARSLVERNYLSEIFGLNLWMIYSHRMLEAADPARLVVTHYDSYFDDPQRELSRVLDRLGVQVPVHQLMEACTAVSHDLRHVRVTAADLAAAAAPPGLLGLYSGLCVLAGRPTGVAPAVEPHGSDAMRHAARDERLYDRLFGTEQEIKRGDGRMPEMEERTTEGSRRAVEALTIENATVLRRLAASERALQAAQLRVADLEGQTLSLIGRLGESVHLVETTQRSAAALMAEGATLSSRLAASERALQAAQQNVAGLEGRCASLTRDLAESARALELIHASRFWRIASVFGRFRRRMASLSS